MRGISLSATCKILMLNFEVKKSSRKCFENQKDFSPGEVFYSALIEREDGDSERRDYCAEHWSEQPEHCIGWWKSKVPETGKGKVYWAPRKVLLSYFQHVLDNPDYADIAFVTGLVLVQRKVLTTDDDGDPSVMQLINRVDKVSYAVPVCEVEPDRLATIQAELAEKLFTDELIDDFDDPSDEASDEVECDVNGDVTDSRGHEHE